MVLRPDCLLNLIEQAVVNSPAAFFLPQDFRVRFPASLFPRPFLPSFELPERSLALWWMLRRRGVDGAAATWCARKDGPQFKAGRRRRAVLGDSSGERERFVRFGEMSDSC